MELTNMTRMQAGYTLGLDRAGRELLVVAVKGTFKIPTDGLEPFLDDLQAPLIDADQFTGEPGFSATRYEFDFAPAKPRCDVLLNGSAYAPGGKPARRVTVELGVGELKKRFNVVGDRVWRRGLFGARASWPQSFSVMPISYDNAFGGLDNLNKNPRKQATCLTNFAGKGFYPKSGIAAIGGKPLPNTEELGKPVKKPGRHYRPMAFGPIGRAWQPRQKLAGTYDQRWIDRTFPFLPEDFNDLYYQAAPPDQQMNYLRGGEKVTLVNLARQGRVSFRLPELDMPVAFVNRGGNETEINAAADTLILEPDLDRFIIVWRAVLPLRKNIFEIESVVAGRRPRGWYRAREAGKEYFASIGAMIDLKRLEGEVQAEADVEEESEWEPKDEELSLP